MASVYLVSSAPPDDPTRPYPYDELGRMREAAERDAVGVHTLASTPETADLILFVENVGTIEHYFSEARRHPLYRRYPEKCFLFSKTDHPMAFLPGVYPSIQKRWHARPRTRSGHFLRTFDADRIDDRHYVGFDVPPERDYLYSFIGSSDTHPIRKMLFDLQHEAQYLFDTASLWPYAELGEEEQAAFEQRYIETIHRSRFVLCPRGRGASSFRLFETMCMGRAPVIISDEWVPPEGPDWASFSVRVPERDVYRIPARLAERQEEAFRMGRKARQAWEEWFALDATFHRIVAWCLDILHERNLPERWLHYTVYLQLLEPLHAREFVRYWLPKRVARALSRSRAPQSVSAA